MQNRLRPVMSLWNLCALGATALFGCSVFSPDKVDIAKGWEAWVSEERGWLNSIALGESLFVAVGGSDKTLKSIVFTSPDGVNWTKRNADTTQWLSSVTWTGNLFVAVGFSGIIFTSPDGVTWLAVEHPKKPGYGNYNDVVWTGDRLIVVGSGIILTSHNGIDWVLKDGTDQFHLNSITWTGKQLIAVGSSGLILTSPDGEIWTTQNSGGVYADLNSVEWTGTLAVATGNSIDAEGKYLSSTMLTSADGYLWDKHDYDVGLCCITWTGSQLIVSRGKGSIMTSIDGLVWNAINYASSDYSIASAIWKEDRLLAVGSRHNDRNYYWPAVFTWRP